MKFQTIFAGVAAFGVVASGFAQYDQDDRYERRNRNQNWGRNRDRVDRGEVRVRVNGTRVDFPGQGAILENDRVLVPLRGVFEQLGADVRWDRESNTVTATRGRRDIVLRLDRPRAQVNGRAMRLDQPAQVINGRALVPLRFLSESLGATVDWNATNLTVNIASRDRDLDRE